ncbi:MAG: putative toxin-antitoxin system toxin component, PIN family [bacterium]
MKILFDSNVLIAALISHGACKDIFDHCLGKHIIYTSQQILREVEKNLTNKFSFTEKETNRAINFLKKNSTIINPISLPFLVCRDPDDDKILASAVSANAGCLITGDNDILILKKFQKIPILKPSDFWKFEKENQQV